MKLADLDLSDSTRGVLKKRGYTLATLLEHREHLGEVAAGKEKTILDGIGPARAKELLVAIQEHETASEYQEETKAVSEKRTAPAAKKARKEEAPEAPAPFEAARVGANVVYTDHSGKRMISRVTLLNEDGKINLLAFTGAGGQRRVENVPRGETGETHRWTPVVEP